MQIDSMNETTLAVVKSKPSVTLKEILAADKDVRDFYKVIDKFNLREKAIELLNAKILKM